MAIRDWADLEDNRIGPILRELAEVLEDTDDPVILAKVANRLKFMSGSIHSHRERVEKKARGW